MGPELLIGVILGAAGATLAFWVGWRAREEWDRPARFRPGYRSINYPDPSPDRRPTNPFNGEPVTFSEGRTVRGNGNGGPGIAKPPIVPKPQFPLPRRIREDFLP